MLTENYKRWINGVQTANSGTGDFTPSGLVNTSGQAASVAGDSRNRNWIWNPTFAYDNNTNMYSSIFVGTGNTTPEAETNYTLDSVCTDCSNDSGSMTFNSATGKITCTKTFTYTGAEPTEIKEIGLFKCIWNSGQPILMAREVLATPISVSNGDTFTVTMTIG